MNVPANIFLIAAALATVVLGIVFAAPLPSGPDRAGIGIVCFMVQVPRWLCLAVVLVMCVRLGAFPWPADRAAQYFVVLLVHALVGLGCIFCGLVAMGAAAHVPVPDWMIRVLTFAPLVIPAMEILFAAWFLNPGLQTTADAQAVRSVTGLALVCFTLTVAAFGVVGAIVGYCDRKQAAQQQAKAATRTNSEEAAKAIAEDRAYQALGPESSLMDWLRFTEFGHTDEHRRAARGAILRRPTLAQDFANGITNGNPEESMKLMYFIGELPKPPVEVAEAVRSRARDVIRLAETIDPAAPNSRDLLYEKAHSIAAGVQAASFGLQRAGIDLSPELQAMADACREREKASPRNIADACDRMIKYFRTPESRTDAPLAQP